jgi:tetratricopeptide (TPR) repeat protein
MVALGYNRFPVEALGIWARRLILPAFLAVAVYAASQAGRLAGAAALAGALLLYVVIFVVLPRLAHGAFERGAFARAELYYRLTRFFVASPAARGAIDVSLAGCRLARADFPGALAELDRVVPTALGVAARAAWNNNRAYALARGGRGDRLELAALSSIDEAVRLRPDIAGFRHTRGVVLLSLGRVDDAIAELDEVWHQVVAGGASADVPALLEAERCYDLGVAWTKKGERDYARDYFTRAQAAAPGSDWAAKAAEALRA